MSASLLALVADRSRAEWGEAPGVVAQAQALERRALALARRTASTYEAARVALAAIGPPEGEAPQESDTGRRDWELGSVIAAAAEPPLALTACAADIAQLATAVATRGAVDLRANAVIAAKLAAAACDSAAHLVAINLVVGADTEQLRLARSRAQAAAEAARAATA